MPSDLKKVRGCPDHLPEEVLKHDLITRKALEVSKCFGFEKIELSLLEYTEIFTRTLGAGSDIVNKEMYTLNKGEESLTLRPEGTASVARLFITNKMRTQLPLRWIYHGPMFRHERPQKGRLRQFQSIAVEVLGETDGDSEVVSLAFLFLKELGLEKKVTLEINNIGSSEIRIRYKEKLKDYLKPFYKNLSPDSQNRFHKNTLRIWDSKKRQDHEIMKKAPLLKEFLDAESLKSYETIKKELEYLKIPFQENERLVRGLDYYNHLVFEFKSPDLGAQSAVLAGGRYDSLIKTLGGPPTKAIGWGAGIERLALLLPPLKPPTMDIGLVALSEEAQEIFLKTAFLLRTEGYKVFYRFSGNLSKQMARLDKKSCALGLILGEQEIKKKIVILRDMKQKKQDSLPFSEPQDLLKKIGELFKSKSTV